MKFLFLVLIASNLFAQQINVSLNCRSDKGYLSQMLQFGMHSEATFNLDTAIGENDLLDTPPPNDYGVFNLMFFQDSIQNLRVYSNSDYIPLASEKTYHEHWFKLWVEPITEETKISWSIPSDGIDSIRLVDEAGGIVYDVNMLEQDSLIIDHNERPVYTLNFMLKVWYNPNSTSINTKELNELSITNNIIDLDSYSSQISIYDLTGALIESRKVKSRYYDLSFLDSNVYFLLIRNENKTHRITFIRN